jgi:outer membrane murein-binding lipoprotein Lpp
MKIGLKIKKQVLVFASILLIILLSGCTLKTDIASKAEDLSYSLERFNEEITALEKKQQLNEKDQDLIISEINNFHDTFAKFKKEEPPFFLKKIKKITVKKLNKKDKILLKIKQKAEKGKATINDIKIIKKEIKDDVNINLFNK